MADITDKDYYSPSSNDGPKLIHSCSKPDKVFIGGKETMANNDDKKGIWDKVDGIFRKAEETFVKLVKK